ncbi:hypothetical protein ABZ896_20625 [Streptomyces sp. NPDC047072]|uniref:hypothetical protein n=1 Tax=Streptomyces sp. NPDC047072 TaxID=3154809 RepID=UPI0033DDB88D
MSTAGDRLQDTARRAALAMPDVSHGYPFTPRLDVYKVARRRAFPDAVCRVTHAPSVSNE